MNEQAIRDMVSYAEASDYIGVAEAIYEWYGKNPFIDSYLKEHFTAGEKKIIEAVVEQFQATAPAGVLYNDHVREAYVSFIEIFDEYCLEKFEDSYEGWHPNDIKFAENYIETCGYDLPDFMANYFDYEWLARDLMLSDYTCCDNGYYFRTHF